MRSESAGDMSTPAGRYTHWLITAGRDPFGAERRSFSPVVLVEKAGVSMRELAALAVDYVERVATVFEVGAPPVVRLAALAGDYYARVALNLWLREVRLAERAVGIDETEMFVDWCIVDTENPRVPPPWQGAADGVIDRRRRVTIWSRHATPSRFEIMD